jgi:hypothetical protein
MQQTDRGHSPAEDEIVRVDFLGFLVVRALKAVSLHSRNALSTYLLCVWKLIRGLKHSEHRPRKLGYDTERALVMGRMRPEYYATHGLNNRTQLANV